MSRKAVWWIAVFAFLIAGIVGLWHVYVPNSEVRLSELAVQDRIGTLVHRSFPVSGKAGLLIKEVTINDVQVHITDDKIGVLIGMNGTLRFGKKFSLTAYAVGAPKYEGGAFYFVPSQVAVQEFSYEGAAPTELFNRYADRYLSDLKIRQLVQDNAPKVEEWMTHLAQSAAMHVLEKKPVYRPKDDVKGWLIRASLRSVEVRDSVIHLHFSLWQLTLTVVLGILAIVVAIGIVLVAPEIGLFFTLLPS